VPLVVIAAGAAKAVVAVASVQYVNVPPPVLPAVTVAAVRSMVLGAQTAPGLVMLNTGNGLTVTVTG